MKPQANINWDSLRQAAWDASQRAYAPYSNYQVGAAALTSQGTVVTGCNVENASFGVTLCAECGMISELINRGGGTLLAFICVNARNEIITPCGRCRQLLSEHSTDQTILMMPSGPSSMSDILPGAFGSDNLNTHRIHEQER